MRCSGCKAENVAGSTVCSACGQTLARRGRGRRSTGTEDDNPFVGPFKASNLPALRAYWVGLWSVIPGAGLLLGPAALLMGLLARRRLTDPEFTARGPLMASLVLGGAVTITNWLGTILIYLGLRNAGWW